jgi:hypothetical protein
MAGVPLRLWSDHLRVMGGDAGDVSVYTDIDVFLNIDSL